MKYKEYKLKTVVKNLWCNDSMFQYFYKRIKNDSNGNARWNVHIIIFDIVLEKNFTCYEFEIKDKCIYLLKEYLNF